MKFLECCVLALVELHAPAVCTALLVLCGVYYLKDYTRSWTYLDDVDDSRHGKLLLECVESGRAGPPVLGLTISGVVLLHSLLLLVDGVLNGLRPLIL